VELVYPTSCFSCDRLIIYEQLLCADCFGLIKPIVSLYLPLSQGKSLIVFAVGAYEGPLKSLIAQKFLSSVYAARLLAALMTNLMDPSIFNVDYIVPIPLHWTRYSVRGFNQASMMAKRISKKVNVPFLPCLKRVKKTSYQWKLSVLDRKKNLANAFILKKGYEKHLIGKKILLIDDLCTTGITLKAAALPLLPYVLSISAAVSSRTLR
jgi:ComF family protein